MASGDTMNSSNQRKEGTSSDIELKISLESEKARAKTKFTQVCNKIPFLIEISE